MIKYITTASIAALIAILTLLIFILPVPEKGSDAAAAQSDFELLIENVRVIQDGKLSAPQSILMRGGKIADIGENLTSTGQRIDGVGLTAMAGLIDAHTHSYGTALEDALRFGVTTNVDMFSDVSLMTGAKALRSSSEPTRKADLFSAGMMATAPGGHGTQYGIAIETLTEPDQASDWVTKRKAEGSDFIKLVYMPDQSRVPSIDRATAQAVINAAHEQGLMALAHISTQAAARDMIEDGIDGLVHIFADQAVSDEVVALAKESDVFIIPTLAVIASVDGRKDAAQLAAREDVRPLLSPMQAQTLTMSFPEGVSGYSLATALNNVKRFHEAGVPILAGSDAPNPGTAHGVSIHQELGYFVDAGLSPSEALASATTLPARFFSMADRGEIKIGLKGDIVLVRGNPLDNIDASLAIESIFKNGQLVDRSAAQSQTGIGLSSGNLGDFETGLSAQDFKWHTTTDAMAQGKSVAAIKRVAGGRDGTSSTHVLKLTGSINPGFPYPWSGAGMWPQTQIGSYDISQFKTVSFDIRGTPGTYRAMIFTAGNMGVPPTQEFNITQDWQQLTLPIKGFAGFDAKTFAGLSFVAGAQGNFEFELDNVTLNK